MLPTLFIIGIQESENRSYKCSQLFIERCEKSSILSNSFLEIELLLNKIEKKHQRFNLLQFENLLEAKLIKASLI